MLLTSPHPLPWLHPSWLWVNPILLLLVLPPQLCSCSAGSAARMQFWRLWRMHASAHAPSMLLTSPLPPPLAASFLAVGEP
jgi:hypothetical protein